MQRNWFWKRSIALLFAPLSALLLGPGRAMATPETFVDDCPLGVVSCFADATVLVLQGPGAGSSSTLPANFEITGNASIDQMPDPDDLQSLILSTIGTIDFVDPNVGNVSVLSATMTLLSVTFWDSPGTGQLSALVNINSEVSIAGGTPFFFNQNQSLDGDLDLLGGGIDLLLEGVTLGVFSTIGNPDVDPALQQVVSVESNVTWRGTVIPEPSAAILYATSLLAVAFRARRKGAIRLGGCVAG